ncbi:hypothetical protein FNV43_RR04790 [Rhamnella rubrinervis]|uniref:Small ribosomal subunit protein eS1 n=1 Tax=Rhamnella rubrinervis TaxID=2594499 RepID=A0A8K0MQL6_9ROSA|nr:hypothetical protein FNV43_RR04790 [Rhamnella rubrinervis]
MVSKSEESQLKSLENQVDNGGGGDWDYLCLVRKLKVRRSDKVLKYGLAILNDSRKRSGLGQEEWTLYEQVAIAAMDCQCLEVAKDCIKVLRKKFSDSKRVGKLEAMLLEAKGSWAEAEKAYSSLLEDNPVDQVVHKRRVAMARAQGNISGAIEWLNKYLEIFMADNDAWRELAEIYISLQMYKQAAFCYEELILSQPTVPIYHLAYADVLYTLGGLENLQTAKKYYASTIDLTGGKNTRALFGICLCTSGIGQLAKGRNKEEKESPELQSLAVTALEKDYKQRAPDKLSLLTTALKKLSKRNPTSSNNHEVEPGPGGCSLSGVPLSQFSAGPRVYINCLPVLSVAASASQTQTLASSHLFAATWPSGTYLCFLNSVFRKNKRISKGKKGGKKKASDPFAKKDWYDIKAPSLFNQRQVGKTLVTRTQGTKIASEGLKHRVFEVSLADLQKDEDNAYRKIRLRAEDVQGRNVLTNFWGMDFTTDKLRSLVRKWQTLIEAHVDVKTTDNYTLRMFCIAFTRRRSNQVKRTCYAQSSQIRQIRRKMREIMINQATSCDLKELVSKFIPEVIGKEIEKATTSIYPLQNVFIRKVKILKAPKFDLGKLMEVHGDYSEDIGTKVERPAEDIVVEAETEVVGA